MFTTGKIIYVVFFLPLIIFTGMVTSFEDWRFSKIRNKWIIFGLIYAAVVYVLAWIMYGLHINNMTTPLLGGIGAFLVRDFDKWCVNLVVSIIVAYGLWHFKMWSPGDGKLFICYAALIPIGQYSRVYFNGYFASLLLLLAIFLPAAVFFLVKSASLSMHTLYRNATRMPDVFKKTLAAKFNKQKIISGIRIFFGFFLLLTLFHVMRNEISNLLSGALSIQWLLAIVLFLAFKRLSRIFKNSTTVLIVSSIFLLLYLLFFLLWPDRTAGFAISHITKSTFLIMMIFPLVQWVIKIYANHIAQQAVVPFAQWIFLGVLLVWFL